MTLEFKSHRPGKAEPAAKTPQTPARSAPAARNEPAGKEAAARQRAASHAEQALKDAEAAKQVRREKEIGGPEGPEPTRYGDWERKGICYDF